MNLCYLPSRIRSKVPGIPRPEVTRKAPSGGEPRVFQGHVLREILVGQGGESIADAMFQHFLLEVCSR